MTDQEITEAGETIGRRAAERCEANAVQWLAALDAQIKAGGKRKIVATLKITILKTDPTGVVMVAVDAPAMKIGATVADEGEMVPALGDDPSARLPGIG